MTHRLIRFRPLLPFPAILITIGFAIFGLAQQAVSQPTQPETQVHVTLKDFSVAPNQTTAPAGWITFQAVNAGTMAHELVILRTDLPADDLPRKAEKDKKGTVTGHIVNEEHSEVEPIGEIEEFPAETFKKKKVLLDPGSYVLFCNVPEHYDKGMYASFIVEK